MKTIQAVIFDWGGVLIENPSPNLDSHCSEALGVPADAFARVRETHYPAFLKGVISEAEFWKRSCGDLGVPLPRVPSLWGEAFRRAYVPRKEMFDLVKVIVPHTPFLITLREPAVAQLVRVDGQVTVTALQDRILHLQQDKIRVSA